MENRVNRILLVAVIVTAALSAYFLLVWIKGIPHPFYDPDDPLRFYELWICLGVGFHAVPCFCLQLLVCRVAERLVTRFIPVFLLAGIVTVFFLFLATSTGWDAWGWSILLLLCAAPAVGYASAWAVYGVQRLCRSVKR